MTCDEALPLIDERVSGEPVTAGSAALDAHLATCDACRARLADFERIRAAARSLDSHPVPPLAWPRVAARLRAEVPSPTAQPLAAATTPRWTAPGWLAAAALLVAAVGLSLWLIGPGGPSASDPDVAASNDNADAPVLVESIGTELERAAEHYENALAGLEALAQSEDSPLEAGVVETLRTNLAIIDRAILESRQALADRPDSQLAQQSLLEAFRQKMALLQDTIALMNEVRKGNEAGAARIAGSLNKS